MPVNENSGQSQLAESFGRWKKPLYQPINQQLMMGGTHVQACAVQQRRSRQGPRTYSPNELLALESEREGS